MKNYMHVRALDEIALCIGFDFSASTVFQSKEKCFRERIIVILFLYAAKWAMLHPELSRACRSPPLPIIMSAALLEPLSTAAKSGVRPVASLASMSAPRSSKSRIIGRLSRSHAMKNAVLP